MNFSVAHPLSILLLLAWAGILLPCLSASEQDTDTIVLGKQPELIVPAGFYVARTSDERQMQRRIGQLIVPAGGPNETKTVFVDFKGGGYNAVKTFFNDNVSVDRSLRPVAVMLKEINVTEHVAAGGYIAGEAGVVLGFDLVYDDISVHLTDYRAQANYTRPAGAAQQVAPLLRNLLANGMEYLDRWIAREGPVNAKLARKVEVSFTDYSTQTADDTIYYSVNRPLRWDDFKSETASSIYAAEVFPTIGYDEEVTVVNGVIRLKLDVKTELAKSACWVKPGAQTDYVLNHEQRHFDIARIAAEGFKQKVRSERLPVFNYDGPINVDFLDAYRKMDTLQREYDDETRHGTNEAVQQQWNKKIDEELRKYGIK